MSYGRSEPEDLNREFNYDLKKFVIEKEFEFEIFQLRQEYEFKMFKLRQEYETKIKNNLAKS